MSRATNQTLLLLAMVNGALKIIEAEGKYDDKTHATGLYAADLVNDLIHRYPASGDERKNLDWMTSKLRTWSEMINEAGKDWHRAVLATMCLDILEDLTGKIRNPVVLDDLRTLRDSIIPLSHGWTFAEEDESKVFAEVTEVREKMYQLIEFRP